MSAVRQVVWIGIGGSVLAMFLAIPNLPKPLTASPREPRGPDLARLMDKPETVILEGSFVPTPASLVVVRTSDGASFDKVMVKPGDVVLEGHALALARLPGVPRLRARFDSGSESEHAERVSNMLGSALSHHEERLKQAQAAYETAKSEHDRRIEQAGAARDRALGAPEAEVEAAKATRAEAQAALDKAKALADRDARALNEGWISRNQATASREAADRAEEALRQADARLTEIQRGPSQAEARRIERDFESVVAVEEAKVEEARRALEDAERGGLALPSGTPVTFGPIGGAPIKGKIPRRIEVKSPIGGRVLSVQPGAVTVLRSNPKYVFVARVDQGVASRMRAGQVAELPGGQRGSVHSIGPSDVKSRKVLVHIVGGGQRGEDGTAVVTLTRP